MTMEKKDSIFDVDRLALEIALRNIEKHKELLKRLAYK